MQIINPDNFKISCSAIHEIMTEPKTKSIFEQILDMEADIAARIEKRDALKDGLKSKSNATEKIDLLKKELIALKLKSETAGPHLSETTKNYCDQWLKIQIYERTPDFTSKYTDKGTQTESDAIDLLNDFYGWNATKNTARKFGEYMHGECDLDLPELDMIDDIKSSYSCFTFPLFDAEIPDKKYIWQIQGYMHLWGRKNGRISYVLMDMPPEMIAQELRWKFKNPPTDEEYRAAAAKYIYSDLSDNLRVKSFDFEYNPEMIASIEQRVRDCRVYIHSLLESM